jgi:putative endonuclease
MSPPVLAPFVVYILRCSDNSLYVGYTENLQERLKAHNDGRGAAWTADRGPVSSYITSRTKTNSQRPRANAN